MPGDVFPWRPETLPRPGGVPPRPGGVPPWPGGQPLGPFPWPGQLHGPAGRVGAALGAGPGRSTFGVGLARGACFGSPRGGLACFCGALADGFVADLLAGRATARSSETICAGACTGRAADFLGAASAFGTLGGVGTAFLVTFSSSPSSAEIAMPATARTVAPPRRPPPCGFAEPSAPHPARRAPP